MVKQSHFFYRVQTLITKHFNVFNFINHFSCQSCRAPKSSCSLFVSSGVRMALCSMQLSVIELCFILSGKSFMQIENSVCQELCPERTGHLGENSPSRTTHCVLQLKKEEIQFLAFPWIPYHSSFYSMHLWGTVSNALAKSAKIMSVCIAVSCHWQKSCDNVINNVHMNENGGHLGYGCSPDVALC